jgi:hypothetical protein
LIDNVFLGAQRLVNIGKNLDGDAHKVIECRTIEVVAAAPPAHAGNAGVRGLENKVIRDYLIICLPSHGIGWLTREKAGHGLWIVIIHGVLTI